MFMKESTMNATVRMPMLIAVWTILTMLPIGAQGLDVIGAGFGRTGTSGKTLLHLSAEFYSDFLVFRSLQERPVSEKR